MAAEGALDLGRADFERNPEQAVMAEPLDPEGLRDATAAQVASAGKEAVGA